MKCPHCLVSFHDQWEFGWIDEDCDGEWWHGKTSCPDCGRTIITLEAYPKRANKTNPRPLSEKTSLIRPKSVSRAPLPAEVPDEFSADYKEACLVVADSPKASAALSRRCLQHLLREKAKVKRGNLSDEIEQVLGTLPSHLAEAIDAIRNVGNFSAHATKSTNTGEIIEVEAGEATWNLDVLEMLFDFYFVQPATVARRRKALNEKLKDAGKPEMK